MVVYRERLPNNTLQGAATAALRLLLRPPERER
jgi:hypothetical protein